MDFGTNIFQISNQNGAPERGRILISEPYSTDSFFSRSVVLLTEHSTDGSVGFILNKPIEFKVENLLQDFPKIDSEFGLGGPVQTDSLYYIHTLGERIPQSIRVFDNLYWGGSFEVVKLLIETGELNPSEIRFFMGYSGWQAGQLQSEIDRNFWLVSDMTVKELITPSAGDMWRQAILTLKEELRMWLNFPKNPSLN